MVPYYYNKLAIMQFKLNSRKVDLCRKKKAESYWRGFFVRVTKHSIVYIILDNCAERHLMKIKIKPLPNT